MGVIYSQDKGSFGTSMTVDLSGGRRFLVGGPRGALRFHVNERYWGVRKTTLGMRAVPSDPKAYRDVAGNRVEEFSSASAPGGPYGSLVVASVPCEDGAGAWTLSTDTEPAVLPEVCVTTSDVVMTDTQTGRVWKLNGPVWGNAWWPYRLLVLDYPRL